MSDAPRSLVVVHRFPVASETFILGDLAGITEHGWNVTVAAEAADREAQRRMGLFYDVRDLGDSARGILGSSRLRQRRGLHRRFGGKLARLLTDSARRGARARAAALFDLCEERRPDLIHAHFGPNGILASFAAKRLDIPLIVDFHGYDLTRFPVERGWDVYRRTLDRAVALVHCRFLEDRVRRHLDMPVEFIEKGVDAKTFCPRTPRTAWSDPLHLLVVGRLVYQKGQETAIEALASLRSGLPALDARLTLVGDGADRDALRERAAEFGVAREVELAGSLPPNEVAEHIRACDILLCPSRPTPGGWEEAFCNAALEGMASGVPVIGTDCGGLLDTIGHGGSVVRADDADVLAEEIRRLVREARPDEIAARAVLRAADFPLGARRRRLDEFCLRVAGLTASS